MGVSKIFQSLESLKQKLIEPSLHIKDPIEKIKAKSLFSMTLTFIPLFAILIVLRHYFLGYPDFLINDLSILTLLIISYIIGKKWSYKSSAILIGIITTFEIYISSSRSFNTLYFIPLPLGFLLIFFSLHIVSIVMFCLTLMIMMIQLLIKGTYPYLLIEFFACFVLNYLVLHGTFKHRNDVEKYRLNRILEHENKFSMLFDQNPIGITLSDLNFNYVQVNNAICKMLGYTENELLEMKFTDITHPDDLQVSTNLAKDIFSKKIQFNRIKKRYITKNNKIINVSIVAGGIYDFNEKPIYIASMVENISEKEESKLELVKAQKITAETLEVKEKLLANVSHEIRTPINVIVGMTELLKTTTLTKEQEQYSDAIKLSSTNLLMLINDILDLSRLEYGKVKTNLANFNLHDLVEEIISMNSIDIKKKDIYLHHTIDPHVPNVLRGDPIHLRQILGNLIGNAIKFTERGGVNLRVIMSESGPKNRTNLTFIIQDTGIGIRKERLKVIFEDFIQGSRDTHKKYGGTGLGLAIIKKLVELQNGKISVSSKINKGTEFKVDLSFTKPRDGELLHKLSNPITDHKTELNGLRVLVTEDNKMNQIILSNLLIKQGVTTDIAENGLVALNLLKKNTYDAILMDLEMPVLDGYSTTKKIRMSKDKKIKNIPIVAVSAHVLIHEKEKALELGMNGFITKPFIPEDLYMSVSNACAKP